MAENEDPKTKCLALLALHALDGEAPAREWAASLNGYIERAKPLGVNLPLVNEDDTEGFQFQVMGALWGNDASVTEKEIYTLGLNGLSLSQIESHEAKLGSQTRNVLGLSEEKVAPHLTFLHDNLPSVIVERVYPYLRGWSRTEIMAMRATLHRDRVSSARFVRDVEASIEGLVDPELHLAERLAEAQSLLGVRFFSPNVAEDEDLYRVIERSHDWLKAHSQGRAYIPSVSTSTRPTKKRSEVVVGGRGVVSARVGSSSFRNEGSALFIGDSQVVSVLPDTKSKGLFWMDGDTPRYGDVRTGVSICGPEGTKAFLASLGDPVFMSIGFSGQK